jgi:HEAT repeat protein
MLSESERRSVLDAIHFYNWLPRHEIDRVREQADAELPYDLIARAAVEDPEATVRWRAVALLDHYADHRHDDALVRAAYDPVPRVRRHAVHALGCDACTRTPSPCIDVLPTLIDRATTDENVKVRRQATFSLVMQIADPRARPTLEQLRRDPDERVRGAARWALDRADREPATRSSS